MTLFDKLEKSRDFWFLLITSFVFFLLRLPSLFEPYWYGDEGIYETLGSAMRHGRILYEGAWDNKPPLLYIVYAIFNGDQFYVRALSLIFGLLSVTAFYFLAKKLFGESKEEAKISMWSTGIFAFMFAIPFIEGNIANSENFMLLLIIFSGFLILSEKLNPKILLISGIILGIAFLFKIVAIFDFTAFAVFIVISKIDLPKRNLLNLNLLKKVFKLLAPFALGFAIPIFITALFFLGPQFKYFFQATFLQNVGYVGWGNKLIIPQGYMILKLILLASCATYLLIKKDKFSKTLLFIIIWFAFSLFNTFFSQRPYAHYLLVLLPSFSLLIGLLLFEKKYKPQLAVFFIISFIFICLGFKFSGKTLSYYQNFTSFILGSKSVREYRGFFDRRTPIDYEIATYIKAKTNNEDNIFIWGNNAQIYKMTDKIPPGRYAVAYHITGYKEGISNTQEALDKKKPKIIVIMPNQPMIPFSLSGYGNVIKIDNTLIYERII